MDLAGGRPGPRRLYSSPRRAAVSRTQVSCPKGRSRRTQVRSVPPVENVIDHSSFSRSSGSWHEGILVSRCGLVIISNVPFSCPKIQKPTEQSMGRARRRLDGIRRDGLIRDARIERSISGKNRAARTTGDGHSAARRSFVILPHRQSIELKELYRAIVRDLRVLR